VYVGLKPLIFCAFRLNRWQILPIDETAVRLNNSPVGVSLIISIFTIRRSFLIFLKTVVTYILIVFVSLAYSYETIQYFSKALGSTSLAWLDDFECEEKSKESEESAEKLKFSDDLYFDGKHLHGKFIADHIELGKLGSRHRCNFLSSDYSHEVYSPPRTL
jgi:hypothetical protein